MSTKISQNTPNTPNTPMMKQFYEIKQTHGDSILFFRMGDFYEMFGDDAVRASKILGLTLTARQKGTPNEIPMCGIPHHAYHKYVPILLKHGEKVAICDQLEDPSLREKTTTLVKRGVTRVVTPGTIMEDESLHEFDNNFLISAALTKGFVHCAIADIATGELFFQKLPCSTETNSPANIQKVLTEIVQKWNAKEVIANHESCLVRNTPFKLMTKKVDPHYLRTRFLNYYNVNNEKGFGLDNTEYLLAFSQLLDYMQDVILEPIFNTPTLLLPQQTLTLDPSAYRNLELVTALDGSQKNTLFSTLNHCQTPMGKRLLKNRLIHPSRNKNEINARLDLIEHFFNAWDLNESVRSVLNEIYDLERIAARLANTKATPKDLITLKTSLHNIQILHSILQTQNNQFIANMLQDAETLIQLAETLENSIIDPPPTNITEGGLIKIGHNNEIDTLKIAYDSLQQKLDNAETEARLHTGIHNLKIGYNKVFGYYFEVSKTHSKKIPDNYERKQSLVNAERFINQNLKKIEEEILGGTDSLHNMEYQEFLLIRETCNAQRNNILQIASLIAQLDFATAMAHVATKYNHTRPHIEHNQNLEIQGGRHCIVEKVLNETQDKEFVPNSTLLNQTQRQILLITGPNMAGKSTYIRQVALITIMAHMGIFVPADKAIIPIMDQIFTRVGANDNLALGESTFMVEMIETANIINNATQNSLIILDEVGRGTSTYDGVAIAFAVVEHIINNIHAKTLFATHYHELAILEESYNAVTNMSMQISENNGSIIFLRQIKDGVANKSYGVHVAQMAGMPTKLIQRANNIMEILENNLNTKKLTQQQNENPDDNSDLANNIPYQGIILFPEKSIGTNKQLDTLTVDRQNEKEYAKYLSIKTHIQNMDMNNTTPVEALTALQTIQKIINNNQK